MRSLIDWLSELGTAKWNRYLRLSQADRLMLAVRWLTFFGAVYLFSMIWHLMRG